MGAVVESAALALIILVLIYIMARLIFRAYFAARSEFINSMVKKAQELQDDGKAR